eukprot:scaffold132089_cov47-Attheya_sp.AAC.2
MEKENHQNQNRAITENGGRMRVQSQSSIVSRIERLRAIGGLKSRTHHQSEVPPHHASLPRASVLVPLFEEGSSSELHVLLTKRPTHLKSHSGQVCFPGGRQEEEDGGDDVQTALRETHEEVGLASDCIDPICRLATMESVNGLCVTPIVAYLKEFQMEQLVLCQQEVEAAFAVPLSYFSEERNCASKEEIEWNGHVFVMRTFFFEDSASGRTFKIWGLTAAIVYQVAQIAMLDEGEFIDQTLTEAAKETTDSSKTTKGSLMRLLVSSSGKSYWSKRFFVKSGDNMLHQYDSEEHASRKSLSATKKNRLPISDCQVSAPASMDQQTQEYTFSVSVLGGRIEWTLAASSETERSKWIAALQQNTLEEMNDLKN